VGTPDVAVVPVLDLGPYLAGAPGALETAAAELRAALEGVGFFLLVNHGVPRDLVQRTFAEARRFHAQPYEAKMKLRMNEHNNGYMAMGRYAVWTSDVNANDQPDLNEAFFVKRERAPDDPLRRSGRRFVGDNQWPDDLPGFRATVLAYTDAVDALGRRMVRVVAAALDLPADSFDTAFAESQFSFRLSHYPPVPAAPNQFGIAPHTDANFLTWSRPTCPGCSCGCRRATGSTCPISPTPSRSMRAT
jgi:isopenicillin N synthase-like dioxygenase